MTENRAGRDRRPPPDVVTAALTDRPPGPGARYVAFYLPVENAGEFDLTITAFNFNLSDTFGNPPTSDYLSFGGYTQAESILQPPFSTLVGLVFLLDNRVDPVGLTYFPQFADPFVSDNHNVHYDFR